MRVATKQEKKVFQAFPKPLIHVGYRNKK